METQLVVIGGGPGGYAAAFLAADMGMQVTLIEAEKRLGGTCLLKGCIPSKALLHVARVMSETREMSEWGVEFAHPKVNIEAMRARKDKVIQNLSNGLSQLAKKRKVQVITARATFENSQALRLTPAEGTKLEDDRLIFEHCILATGSLPAMPSAFKLPTDRVMDSTGALDLADVPESLLVIGGGYIGLEMGTVYAELGSKVTVVELTPFLLPGADRDLVKPLHDRLAKHFANIYLETKVTSLTDGGDYIEVNFEGAGGQKSERFSRVLVSVG
ncbi:MAG TPA: NAD(P)/FAD-dependent oxidoreductase, partial [Pirellulales bacterium]|nr:NAD(P)/FAD-dependent oxidoreductase [Pirellulales bacterium]